eukprot:m.124038 g.124038  ORF g.124038 m.124038 type:complete len:85 (+) comp15688_c0_seq1:2642-2896(+)
MDAVPLLSLMMNEPKPCLDQSNCNLLSRFSTSQSMLLAMLPSRIVCSLRTSTAWRDTKESFNLLLIHHKDDNKDCQQEQHHVGA